MRGICDACTRKWVGNHIHGMCDNICKLGYEVLPKAQFVVNLNCDQDAPDLAEMEHGLHADKYS